MANDNPVPCGYEREYRNLLPDVESSNPTSRLRFMQWNILAQAFAAIDQFVHCPPNLLTLEARCEQMVSEIFRFNPDVICLQEVDMLHHLLNRLNRTSAKYAAAFAPKIHSPCLTIEGNIGPDGAAIIYRSDRLTVLQTKELPLDALHERTALLCELQLTFSRKAPSFYVISVHLKAKLPFVQLRLEQGTFLRDELMKLCSNFDAIRHSTPLFVCGDFNAEPHEPVIQLMQQGFTHTTTKHSWNLASAYASANKGVEPDYTTWKVCSNTEQGASEELFHTIDYVFYSQESVQLCGVWWPPSRQTVGPNGLPSSIFPSDHMNLIADFNLQAVDNTERQFL